MQTAWAFGLVALMLLSGCAGSEPVGPTATSAPETRGSVGDDRETTTTSSPSRSTRTSTSSEPATSSTTTSDTSTGPGPTQPEEPTYLTRVVSEQGFLPPCAGSPDIAGVMLPCTFLGSDRWFRQDIPGTVVGANLTLTWTAATPLTNELWFAFSPIEETSNGGESFTGDSRIVEGTSPLTLSLSDLGWTGGMYTVAVWWSGDAAGGLDQDFSIAGEIHYE